jgi:hypothetical protein
MAQSPHSSYAAFRPDLSEARLLSIAHRKAVELDAARQTAAQMEPPRVRTLAAFLTDDYGMCGGVRMLTCRMRLRLDPSVSWGALCQGHRPIPPTSLWLRWGQQSIA